MSLGASEPEDSGVLSRDSGILAGNLVARQAFIPPDDVPEG